MFIWASLALAAEPLTADAAVERAWQAHPDRVALEARLDVAGLERSRPREMQFRPSIRDLGGLDDPSTRWRFRQPLEPPGSLRAERRARQGALDAERVALRMLRVEVRREVLEAWDDALVQRARAALLTEMVALHEERERLARLRLDEGLPVAKDVIDAALERAEAEARLLEAEQRLSAALATLADRTGAEDVALPDASLADLVRAPLPDVVGATDPLSAAVEHARLELAAEKAARRPFFEWVQADVEFAPDRGPEFGVAAAIDLPLWRHLDGGVASARATVEHLERQQADTAGDFDRELSRTEKVWTAAVERLQTATAAGARASSVVEELLDQITPDEALAVRAEALDLQRRTIDLAETALGHRRLAEAVRLAGHAVVE